MPAALIIVPNFVNRAITTSADVPAALIIVPNVVNQGPAGSDCIYSTPCPPLESLSARPCRSSFAVVFYFLLETRQAQGGGTLLPLAAP